MEVAKRLTPPLECDTEPQSHMHKSTRATKTPVEFSWMHCLFLLRTRIGLQVQTNSAVDVAFAERGRDRSVSSGIRRCEGNNQLHRYTIAVERRPNLVGNILCHTLPRIRASCGNQRRARVDDIQDIRSTSNLAVVHFGTISHVHEIVNLTRFRQVVVRALILKSELTINNLRSLRGLHHADNYGSNKQQKQKN